MRRKLLYVFCLLAFSGAASGAMAQSAKILGKVSDKTNGESLPSANVYIPELSRGSVTDVEGRFEILVPPGAYTLEVSFIGYRKSSTKVTVGNEDVTVDIALEPSNLNLDELIVVGFGSQSKRSLTGSIAQVTGTEIENTPVNTIESALQGRASGVFIQQNNGKLGQGMQVRVRGSSSVTGGNQPLYIIDGVPVVTEDLSTTTAATNPLAGFNFNDVESIQILKDASAAAIYGSRAANGVVLITTKQGRAGRTQFNYNVQRAWSEPTRLMEFMNAEEYVNYMMHAAENTDRRMGTGTTYQDYLAGVFDFYSLGTDWRNYEVDTDWQSLAFQDAGMISHDLSASGGNDATRFFVSGHYSDQDGILIKDRFQRITGRLNLEHTASKKIRLGVNMTTGRTFHQRLANDNAFATPLQTVAQIPISPAYLPGTDILNPDTYYYNGLMHRDFATFVVKQLRTTGNAYASYRLHPTLQLHSEFSADLLTTNDDDYYGVETGRGFGVAAEGGYGSSTWQQNANYTTSHYLNYNSDFSNEHVISGTLGMSYQYSDYTVTQTEGQGFPSGSFRRLTSAATTLSGSSNGSEYSFLSYFARANYTLRDRYLLSASGRIDGSSRFGADNRYGVFPAASVGWILTEEAFASSFNRLLPYLKLRASYGVTGNAAIANFGSLGLWGGTSYAGESGIAPSQMPNPDLTWETTQQMDVGLDFGLVGNRITGEIDYYVKKTKDLLLSVQIPSTSGFTTSLQNVGNMENKGWELVINTFNLTGEFTWNTSFNIAQNLNKVTNLDGQVLTGGFINRAIEGEPIGVYYGREFAGVDPENGDALFNIYDADGNLTGTTNNYNAATLRVIGNPNPNFIGGLSNTFGYKGFDVNVLFQFVQGNDAYVGGAGRYNRGNGIYEDNSVRDQLNSWTPSNRNTNVPEARLYLANGNQHSSRYITDASYLRLKNVTLSYTLPTRLLAGVGLNRVRIYGTGVNLLTFTSYAGWDPEMNTDFLAGNIGLGNDFYTAPQARTLSLGIDIGF